jgi:O-antigen/teichoic acid export membrane protein
MTSRIGGLQVLGVKRLLKSQKLKQIMNKSIWAIMDQGFFAVSNFGLYVFLARWLSIQNYGVFTLGYSIFLLLGNVHTAILTEPMLVFTPKKAKGLVGKYLNFILRGHLKVSAIFSVTLIIASLFIDIYSNRFSGMVLILAFTTPLMLLLWMFRRMCYVLSKPRVAAFGSFIYLLFILLGIVITNLLDILSTETAFLIIGISSMIISLIISKLLDFKLLNLSNEKKLVKEFAIEQKKYGIWALGSGIMTWIPSNLYYLVMPKLSSIESNAVFKALLNTVMPLSHTIAALSILLLPILAKSKDFQVFNRKVVLSIIVLICGGLSYLLLLGILNEPIINLLYGKEYSEYSNLLWFIGLIPLVNGIVSILGTALRALEKPNLVFKSVLISSIITLIVGIPMISWFGLIGAIIGYLSSLSAAAIVMFIYYIKLCWSKEN